jgi:HSP20 family molecular chaperone IbpA
MYYTNFDKVLDSLFEIDSPIWKNNSTTFVPSKFAVDVIDDKAYIALSVLGHEPKNIEINCYEDKIEVKAKKNEEKTAFNQLVGNINETITLGKDLDGRNAKAEIKNGILSIVVERKEESKPKKLTIKVG